MLSLEELGLISGAGGTLNQTVTIGSNGRGGMGGKERGLVLIGRPHAEKHLPVVVVTRLAKEVFSLLPAPDEIAALMEIVAAIDKTELTAIELGEIQYLPDGSGAIANTSEVWRASPEQV
ncbi:MAG: hypothetical protein QOE79_2583 [Sphingomonadales bacterium]|nr:hypothetical protein [Sphingomonadales bacterium]